MVDKVRLVAEFGSCHMGKLERIYEAIDVCKKSGIDALKLQLFPNTPQYTDSGNIWLDPYYLYKAIDYGKMQGLDVSASVFDEESFQGLLMQKPSFIKFAYSKKEQREWIEATGRAGLEPIVSCDVMTDHLVPEYATKLYCIANYPVQFEVSFDELFPRFAGFSDHTLGIRQTRNAIFAGAKIIEKHVRLGYDDELRCPDGRFAVTIEEYASVR